MRFTPSIFLPLFSLYLSLPLALADMCNTTDPATLKCTNGGTLRCCQISLAGDFFPIVVLAKIIGYQLDPNDVNCLQSLTTPCPGLPACCKTGLLGIGLYCQAPVAA
ncbi:hypothetical protein K402DRAFT_452425 [Aulographum hederae CBS 113979]|uniref:Hydrophobin n=1 Tax=Aulographum hederae CBS 113979 TaxID=1176131 RepID=A0A6G1H842_9PEZI|nr:hypothetical protein K402DRAFT_452425 [Aulographum hederae CBS 113979]